MLIKVTLIVTGLIAPVQDRQGAAPDATAQSTPTQAGAWPTDAMLKGLLARWADNTAETLQLSEHQSQHLRSTIDKQWTQLLAAHRGALQTLLNEYLETRLSPDPPDSARLRDWAARAAPVFRMLEREVRRTYDSLSDTLTAEQKARLNLEIIKVNTRWQRVGDQMNAWSRGDFQNPAWWTDSAEMQRRLQAHAAGQTRAPAAAHQPVSRIDREMLRWRHYVLQFCDTYQLDDRQREAAFSILRECQEKVTAHGERNRTRIGELDRDLDRDLDRALDRPNPLSDDTKSAVLELFGPIDAVFLDLQARLRQIPTQAQRDTAGTAHPADTADAPRQGTQIPGPRDDR